MWRTNKFMDFTQSPMGITTPDMHIWERRLLYCVPVSRCIHVILAFCCTIVADRGVVIVLMHGLGSRIEFVD